MPLPKEQFVMASNRTSRRSQTLDPLQLVQLCAALHEQRRFRLAQISSLEAGPGGVQEAVHEEISDSLLRGARLALTEIDAALDRAADGRYGICTSCGRPIAVERLEILPMVATCMCCQRRLEVHRPRTGSARR
jgi:RNA polymerase-binding transcription factor DksA